MKKDENYNFCKQNKKKKQRLCRDVFSQYPYKATITKTLANYCSKKTVMFRAVTEKNHSMNMYKCFKISDEDGFYYLASIHEEKPSLVVMKTLPNQIVFIDAYVTGTNIN